MFVSLAQFSDVLIEGEEVGESCLALTESWRKRVFVSGSKGVQLFTVQTSFRIGMQAGYLK